MASILIVAFPDNLGTGGQTLQIEVPKENAQALAQAMRETKGLIHASEITGKIIGELMKIDSCVVLDDSPIAPVEPLAATEEQAQAEPTPHKKRKGK